MSVCFFKSLPNGEYSNLSIVANFSNSHFFGKTSPPVKNSYLPTFSDDKAEISAVFFVEIILTFVLLDVLIFFTKIHFIIGSF